MVVLLVVVVMLVVVQNRPDTARAYVEDGDWSSFRRFGRLGRGLSLVRGCLVHCVGVIW